MSEPSGTDDHAATVAKLESQLEAARQSAAKYRIARNAALRRGHALQTVLNSHQIAFDIENADLDGLHISDGAVQGDFPYTPPAPKTPPPSDPPGNATNALTRDDVAAMSADDIADNWEAAMAAMAQG